MMEKIETNKDHSWDYLIKQRIVIKKLSEILDVDQQYLMFQTNFINAMNLDNKYLAVKTLNKAIDRIKELIK